MADVKFSELTELTTPASAGILAVVDTSASTSKKLTINSLFGAVPVDVRIDDATDTSSTTTGSIQTDGGIGVAKGLHVGLASNLVGAVTIGTGLVPDASDGAYLGTSSLEFSDIFLADGAVISLGDGGADVTLTHVADTGVQVNDTNKIMFHDASQFIQGVSATVLGLGATDEIDLTATTIDVNGILNVSGAVVPAASDGAALGSASLEWSDLFLADAGVINFGADQDVTLTHVADTGLMLNAAMQLRFRDSAILIGSSQDGQLDIDADTEVEITTTTLDLNGALDVSTTTTLAGVVTVNTGIIPDADAGAYLGTSSAGFADLFLADGGTITMGNDQDVTITHDPDDGLFIKSVATADDNPVLITLQSGETDVAAADVLGQINFQAPDEGEGTDAILVAASIAAVSEGDFSSSSNATKLSFMTGASEVAAEKMALSSAGILTVTSSVVPSASDGGALGSAALEWSDLFLADGAVISFQDDQAVTLTSSATGLTLNSTNKIMFNDASQFIQGSSATVLSIAATDEIDLTATAVDLNGTLNASGLVTIQTGMVPDASDGAYLGTTALQFSDLFLADAAVINLGDDQDVTLTHVADTGVLLNSDNVIQFRDTGLTIGSSADGTLDVVADTILDLDAATVTLTKAGADQVIKHATDAYDLVFQQYDADEVARIHDGAKSVVTNLEATAAGKGGFGFKRPVYKSTPGSDDETVALTAAHSGCLVQVVGAAYDMDYTLPAIASGDEGWHITFVVTNAFSGTNNLEIRTNGASADDNDAIHLYKNTAGTTAVDVDGGDVLRSAADIPAGTMIRLTCVLGGAAEVWIAEWMQPSGSAPTTETAVA